ncbi:hypothetical protein EVAR_77846_1 [Eumeta japonica]|uniref:Uncharacterized protein n=1 Tax=Eumeta variegata TaxID=151549 RepID=A0A4C1TB53_EUMVA|nr:hypothetical protein EVAR_77846_1 [Eumeta japonica]
MARLRLIDRCRCNAICLSRRSSDVGGRREKGLPFDGRPCSSEQFNSRSAKSITPWTALSTQTQKRVQVECGRDMIAGFQADSSRHVYDIIAKRPSTAQLLQNKPTLTEVK